MTLPAGVLDLIGPYLSRQRWYAGTGAPATSALKIVDTSRLVTLAETRHLHWAIVEADGVRYQLLIGERPESAPAAGDGSGSSSASSAGSLGPDSARLGPSALLGEVGSAAFYDATFDAELMLALFEVMIGATAAKVRPVGVEQSNTSLVYDDRIIVKIYRRLLEGANPDIEVTTALASAGFDHVAEPAGVWRADGVDLAFGQRFLAGGSEGWALALDSVRDLCAAGERQADGVDPGQAPADFAGEANRLGRMTAEMHLALAEAFPVDPDRLAAGWSAFVDDLEQRLIEELGDTGEAQRRLIERLRQVSDPGPAQRTHGDYHLGQVMRAGDVWYVLDFEGEPARTMEERVAPSSVAKDITGMLRSLDYASRFVLKERSGSAGSTDGPHAEAWEERNRVAFLDGYLSTEGVDALLTDSADRVSVLAAFELDKALYELRYEQAYRPDWVDIPRDAIARIVARLA